MHPIIESDELEEKLFLFTEELIRIKYLGLVKNAEPTISDGILYYYNEDCVLVETATNILQRIFRRNIVSIEKLE